MITFHKFVMSISWYFLQCTQLQFQTPTDVTGKYIHRSHQQISWLCFAYYHLVISHSYGKSLFSMDKSTISMVIASRRPVANEVAGRTWIQTFGRKLLHDGLWQQHLPSQNIAGLKASPNIWTRMQHSCTTKGLMLCLGLVDCSLYTF